jgi:hypothetical protein
MEEVMLGRILFSGLAVLALGACGATSPDTSTGSGTNAPQGSHAGTGLVAQLASVKNYCDQNVGPKDQCAQGQGQSPVTDRFFAMADNLCGVLYPDVATLATALGGQSSRTSYISGFPDFADPTTDRLTGNSSPQGTSLNCPWDITFSESPSQAEQTSLLVDVRFYYPGSTFVIESKCASGDIRGTCQSLNLGDGGVLIVDRSGTTVQVQVTKQPYRVEIRLGPKSIGYTGNAAITQQVVGDIQQIASTAVHSLG